MALFNWGLKCKVCGVLDSKYTKKEFAEKHVNEHLEACKLALGEDDHVTKVIELSKQRAFNEEDFDI